MKKQIRKTTVKIKMRFNFLSFSTWRRTMFLLSTYWHENIQNIFCLQAEKNIILSTYWIKNMMNFTKIWDPVFDSHGILPKWISTFWVWILFTFFTFNDSYDHVVRIIVLYYEGGRKNHIRFIPNMYFKVYIWIWIYLLIIDVFTS